MQRPYIDLDFGKVVSGHVVLDIAAASNPPPQLRLSFAETQEYLVFHSDYSPEDYAAPRGGTDGHVPISTGEKWIDKAGCQFGTQVCATGIRGFRYVRMFIDQEPGAESHSALDGWIEFNSLHLNFTPYLGTPDTYKGHFLSSDNLLNRIWYGSTYTVELNTDTYTNDTIDPRSAYSEFLNGKIVYHDGAKRCVLLLNYRSLET